MYGLLKYTPNEKKTAIYARISDDEKKRGSYDSISNQINILKELAAKKGLSNIEIYRDDGMTGGNFDRPEFNRMIADIENGHINCILVKDLSRFGREHINGDYYLEIFLPKHNVRFITKHEGFDSYLDPTRMNSIEAPLINLFNEQYLKQVSNSTKASLKIKRKEGKYVGSRVPYGYLRSPADKHKLIVDEEVREVIENIFDMYLKNISLNEISRILSSRNILTPSEHRNKRKGLDVRNDKSWCKHTIKAILTQDILTGNMVQGKTISYSHKVKKRIPLSRDKWTIVKNTHEAIIDESTFNSVQALLEKETRPKNAKSNNATKPSLLAGFIACADCGKQMQRTKTTKDGKVHYYFRCSTNKQLGSAECLSHLIPEDAILDVLLISINSIIDNFIDIEDALKRNANKEKYMLRKRMEHKLDAAVKESARLTNTRTNLYHMYINKLDDTLTGDAYIDLRNNIDKMKSENDDHIKTLKSDIEALDRDEEYTTNFMKNFGKYQGIQKLSRSIIANMVEKIIITADKSIHIDFKFQDEISKYTE